MAFQRQLVRDIPRPVGYLGYYVAWLSFSYLLREPWLLVGLVGLWLLRGLLPPPGALLGALRRAGRLREQVSLNRANITARRDLATLHLSLLRPRRALSLLDEGLSLAPQDPELLYLSGVALQRSGRHDEALSRLLLALEKDSQLRHGQPYFVAGEALLALSRWDDAADAFERYLDFNGSDVAAHTCLARAHAGARDEGEARKWLLLGLSTFHGLSGPLKRRQLGAYLGAQWARIAVLKDTGAMAVAGLLLVLGGGGARVAYPLLAGLWQARPEEQLLEQLAESVALCGTQQTGAFAGVYDASAEPPTDDAGQSGLSRLSPAERLRWQQAMAPRYADFRIEADRIVSGRGLVREFCLTRVLARTPELLHAETVLRVRRGRPEASGDDSADGDVLDESDWDDGTAVGLFDIRLNRGKDATRFSFSPLAHPLSPTLVTLRRRQ